MMDEEMEIIDGYLEGILSEKELLFFNKRLEKDEVLRQQVEELQLVRAGILQASRKEALNVLKVLEATLPEVETPVIPLWRNRWLQVAASITVLAVCSYLLWPKPKDSDQLFALYFEPYPNVIMPTVRGGINNDSTVKAQAYRAYDQQDYAEAIRLFEAVQQKDEGVFLYLGNSYLASGQPEKALPLLEKVLNEYEVFDEQAEWYVAVSYLKLEEREKARAALQKVVARESSYKSKAQLILEKLN